MAEKVGNNESEFGSVTSSQISFLNNCAFANPLRGVENTESDTTEVLGTPVSPPVTRTPILSISVDSINDEDAFRTPPENAYLSSAAESEPRARVSEIKPRRGGGGSKSKSPPPVSAPPSLAVENARVSETNRIADPEEFVTDVTPLTSPPPPSFAAKSKSKSPSPVSASHPLPVETVTVLDRKESLTKVTPHLASPPSLAAGNARVPGRQSDLGSSPPSATEGIKVTDDYEIEIPFREVIEALLRNSGEYLYERDERVSYTDILKRSGP